MENKCLKLNKNINACKINECINKIQILSHNSASPSNIWILNFKNNTKYENQEIKQGFLKFFINNYKPKNLGLLYEIKVYKYIVRKLLDNDVCPHFIKFIASSNIKNPCKYKDLFFMLYNKDINGKNMNKDEINFLLTSSINQIDHNIKHINDRNNYNIDIKNKFTDLHNKFNNYSYSFLINEMIHKNTFTLNEFMMFIIQEDHKIYNEIIVSIMYQIMLTCYVMSLCKMTHNDMHLGNIWIEEISEDEYDENENFKSFYYCINNNRVIRLKTQYKVMIFDFDRTYVEKLGKNNLLNENSCKIRFHCNISVTIKDLLESFVGLLNFNIDIINDILINVVFKDKTNQKIQYLMKTIKHNHFFQDFINGGHLPLEFFISSETLEFYKNEKFDKTKIENNFHSLEKIVENMEEYIQNNYKNNIIDIINKDNIKYYKNLNIDKIYTINQDYINQILN